MHFCRRDRSRATVAKLLQAPLSLGPPNTLRLVRAELLQTREKPFRQSGAILHFEVERTFQNFREICPYCASP